MIDFEGTSRWIVFWGLSALSCHGLDLQREFSHTDVRILSGQTSLNIIIILAFTDPDPDLTTVYVLFWNSFVAIVK